MRSKFSIEEVAEMLDMKTKAVNKEIKEGHLSYTFDDGEKCISLYDLEKYMGAERTREITQEFMEDHGS